MNARTRLRAMTMKRAWVGLLLILAALIVGLALLPAARAGDAGDYVLDWWSIDAGGGSSRGGPYVLSGAIGPPDAGKLAGGDYEVIGGFWAPFELWPRLYLPALPAE